MRTYLHSLPDVCVLVALALGCAPLGCHADVVEATPSSAPAAPAGQRAERDVAPVSDVEAVRAMASAYGDVPAAPPAGYYEDAARLAVLQGRLAVILATEATLDRAARGRAKALEATRARLADDARGVRRAVDDVLAAAPALRAPDGGAIDASHVLEARFWRRVAASGDEIARATTTDDARSPAAFRALAADVARLARAEAHERIADEEVQALLSPDEIRGLRRGASPRSARP